MKLTDITKLEPGTPFVLNRRNELIFDRTPNQAEIYAYKPSGEGEKEPVAFVLQHSMPRVGSWVASGLISRRDRVLPLQKERLPTEAQKILDETVAPLPPPQEPPV